MSKTFTKLFAVIFAAALIISQFWSCSTAQRISIAKESTPALAAATDAKETAQPSTGVKFVLKVDVREKLLHLSPQSGQSDFQKAFQLAKKNQQNSPADFVTLFGEAYQQIAPNQLLNKYFLNTDEAQGKINPNSSNEATLVVIRNIIDFYVEQTHKTLKERVDSLDLTYTAVLLDKEKHEITIKIGGVQDLERFRDYLVARGSLEFWDTYDNAEVYNELVKLDNELKKRGVDENGDSVLLFKLLSPIMPEEEGSRIARIGEARADNVNSTNDLLASNEAQKIFPQALRFVWDVRASFDKSDNKAYRSLYALNTQNRGPPPLSGAHIKAAKADYDNFNQVIVTIDMDDYAAKVWKEMTQRNIGRCIAMLFDGQAYSVPRVMETIAGGKTQITGNFDNFAKAKDFANILAVGQLACPVILLEESIWQ